jgi:glycine/D-amino acid oxidase-like deaminating enzyme
MSVNAYDLAIVGGGVMGLYTALEAKRHYPEARVVVLEKASIGAGASHYAPGIQVAIGRTKVERDLARRGLQAWDRLFPRESWPVGRRCDLFWIASDAASLRDWHVGDGLGPSSSSNLMSRLSCFAAAAIPPDRAVLVDWCSYSPVRDIVGELERRLKGIGCEIRENFDVADVRPDGVGVDILSVDGRTLRAGRAVVAIGPWLPGSRLLSDAQLRHQPRVKKVVSFHLDRRPTPDCPAIAIQEDYAFLIPMIENGYWLFSFTSNHWDVIPLASELHVDEADIEGGMAILKKWFPEVTPSILSTRVFCDCYAADGIPFVAPHRFSRRVAFVGGGSGNGFRFAPPRAEDVLDAVWPLVEPASSSQHSYPLISLADESNA